MPDPDLNSPLADRMRPRSLEEYVGQSHILSPGKLLWRIIKTDRLSCLIFYGPPGTGKTSLARVIAQSTRSDFLTVNAVLGGVKDIREAIEIAGDNLKSHHRRTVLFIDEVHRFNKSQQDALLPHTENGTIIFIGATTENPYFEVNKALISRSRVFELKSLDRKELRQALNMALKDDGRGFGKLDIHIDEDAIEHWIATANGDARALFNALELAVLSSEPNAENRIRIDLETAEESIRKKAALYDKDGDAHYDIISSFIKSLRGSDVDAALYWMARMVYAGEDPRFIFRRMIIFASEDVGMANPDALKIVMSAAQAFDYVGMPEGRFHLAQACIYLATAEKSNSCFAFFDALDSVGKEKDYEPPNPLKDGNRDKEGLNHGKGYLYPHAYEEHWVAQQYLPEALTGKLFYQPGSLGYEKSVKKKVEEHRSMQLEMLSESAKPPSAQDYWGERTMDSSQILPEIKRILTQDISPDPNSMLLQLNSASGYLISDFFQKGQNQIIYAHVQSAEQAQMQKHLFSGQTRPERFKRQDSKQTDHSGNLRIVEEPKVDKLLDKFAEHDFRFDFILGKNALNEEKDKKEIFRKLYLRLQKAGTLRLIEPFPQEGQRISEILEECGVRPEYRERVREIEEFFLTDPENIKIDIDPEFFSQVLKEIGFEKVQVSSFSLHRDLTLNLQKLNQLLLENKNFQSKLAETMSSEELSSFREGILLHLNRKKIRWKSAFILIQAKKPG